ncbi:MAG: transcription-repair coupling factor [Chloroflexi bacterium]|nr:transcription-repair coupling factor [Chloroflexota bacterium]
MSLFGIIAPILRTPEFQHLAGAIRARSLDPARGLGIPRAARAVLIAALQHELRRPIVYVTASVETSRSTSDALRALLLTGADMTAANGVATILRFIEPNTAFYDTVAPVMDVILQRSVVLAALSSNLAGWKDPSGLVAPVVVTSPRALMHPSPPPAQFTAANRVLRRDQSIALEPTIAQWVSVGYESESVVERIGAFSRRGGIIDVWSPALALPARIELFGNQIESIRLFDPGTQRSGEMIERLVVTPLESIPAPRGAEEQGSRGAGEQGREGEGASLVDYLGEGGLLVIDDEEELRDAWAMLVSKAERERETMIPADGDGEVQDTRARYESANGVPYITWEQFSTARQRQPNVVVLGQSVDVPMLSHHPLAGPFSPAPHFAGQLSPLMDYLRANTAAAAAGPNIDSVVVSRQAARLAELWSERHSAIVAQSSLDEPPQGALTFVTGALPEGFVFSNLTVITDAEIFGHVRPEPWTSGRARKSAPERAFADWQSGDVVVHEDYGIGIFRGLAHLTVSTGTAAEPAEGEREYILLEYADADRLYVPLHQLDRISRYVGSDDSRPTLNKLGTAEWTQTRVKARGAAAEVAREMLQLYASRELAKSIPLGKDTPWQAELEASFPYVETDDQLRAIQEVKRDLELPKPMDRLICGDVGYGKTEVALRAAFKAVQEDMQVAVLVPTTVLAQQHWRTFDRRLAPYPIKIEMLSRFRTPAEKRKVVEGLRDGSVDIVIGTHALLADNVQFANLGLLIIDEEQRFGIKAKEKLKQLRTDVHIMTLTATPIPRTLYLGLSGIRDISRIETPPAERLPIISYVGPFDDMVVKQAIQRELDREGQVFFVHNRVNTIHLLEQKLRRLVPDARMNVAHGQMEERQLARIMNDFADGNTDVLLSTNIVESGLDIPNANTIIVDRADHFGLADLYQLRGRVGRSTTQAYAYFLYDRRTHMTPEARERLETLREAAGIGAGYMIAMRDLELRGAGDILGPRQSGQVAVIGLDLYTRLLAREVATLRALRDGTPPPEPEPSPVTIDLPLTIGLPQNYIGDQSLRLQMYRRVASLDTEEKIRLFEEELEDRFGRLPLPALNLTYQARLKLHATRLGAQSIQSEGNRFIIRADAIEHIDRMALVRLLGEDAIIGRRQVTFLRSGPPEIWKTRLMQVMEKLAEMRVVGD